MVNIVGVNLFENFLDVVVKYGGLIPEIPPDIDPTGRTDLLKVLDHGKKEGHISEPDSLSIHEDATLGMNAYSIRITSNTDLEDELLVVPIHMLASVGFVKDEGKNIVVMKIGEVGGSSDISDLAVLYCSTGEVAESICRTLEQCFDLVFSEANHQLLAKKMAAERGSSSQTVGLDNSDSISSISGQRGPEGLSFMTGSTQQLHRLTGGAAAGGGGGSPFKSPPTIVRRDGCHHTRYASTASPSDSDRISQSADLIHEYMRTLMVHLSPDELRQFGGLLNRWTSENLPFSEFLQKVLELYGAERKHLLGRIRPFVKQDLDVAYFENFLEISGITDNAESSLASYSPATDSLQSRNTVFDRQSDWNSFRMMPLPPLNLTQTPSSFPTTANGDLEEDEDGRIEEHRL